MENKGIINFSDFIGDDKIKNTDFNREEFNDFFLPENQNENNEQLETTDSEVSNTETEKVEEKVVESVETVESVEENSEEPIKEIEEEKIIEEVEEEVVSTVESNENYYSVFKDKSEDFSCDISLEGANLSNTEARLILETDDWNLVFNGEISKDGKCLIPIKKLSILNEGQIGKIKLEVIAEGTVFTPWEDDFKVKVSKKVSVKINETKSNPKKADTKKSAVKVNIKR
jgi:hypothetical protein